MEQKRVLILAEHNDEIKKELKRRFSARCELMFAEDLQNLDATLSRAEMIIGEPEQEQLVKAKALSLLQLTWAGADKYARMEHFPEQVTLCNVSGAFGTVISEFVLGSIVAFYRRCLPIGATRNRIFGSSGNLRGRFAESARWSLAWATSAGTSRGACRPSAQGSRACSGQRRRAFPRASPRRIRWNFSTNCCQKPISW